MTETTITERETRVELPVGSWITDGTFTGHLVRFTGEEIGSFGPTAEDTTTYTLYRCPMPGAPSGGGGDVGYRVHVKEWWAYPDLPGQAHLEPTGPDEHIPFTEEDARQGFPELFAAVGMPNVIDLD